MTIKSFQKYARLIDEVDDTRKGLEPNGIWVYLKPGYQNGFDPGCHQIHEDTVRECVISLSAVEPCDCDDCKQCLARRAKKAGV